MMQPSRPILGAILLALSLSPACGQADEAALHFSGSQVLSVKPVPIGPHTLELWVRPEGILPPGHQSAVIFDWGGRVSLQNSQEGLDYLVDLGGMTPTRASTDPLQPQQWHHVAVSYNGSQMLIMIDSKIVNARLIKGEIAGGPEEPLAFGAPLSPHLALIPFTGSLDELRLWDHTRTKGAVEDFLYDHLPGGMNGLMGYWDLDEGKGSTAADMAGRFDALLGDSPGADSRDPVWTEATPPIRKPDPGFELGFQPLSPLLLKSGESFQVACILSIARGATSGGVTSWNIAVRHDRKHLILDDVDLEETAAELRQADGFALFEFLDDGFLAGFKSRVVLSESFGTALPPTGTFLLANTRYHGKLNFTESVDSYIRYDDRLPDEDDGAGPLQNLVVADGVEKLPAEGRLVAKISEPAFSLAFEPGELAVLPGQEFAVRSALTTSGNRALTGASAWSIAVAHDPDVLEFLGADTTGTVLEQFKSSDVFLLNEKVDNETGVGFISVVVFTSTCINPDNGAEEICSLPRNGKEAIISMRYRVRDGVELGSSSRISFTDGLRGSGVPVDNHVTFVGGTVRPETEDFILQISREPFIRGEANGDGKVRISDAIFIVNALFQIGKPVSCLDAADVNDDGKIKISDPIYLVRFLFQNGPPPPKPFPLPGADPTDSDQLNCREYP